MKYLFSLIVLLTLFSSCKNEISQKSKNLNLDIGELISGFKELKNANVSLVPLNIPDSIFFGAINHIKIYDDLIFLMDEAQTNSLTIVTKDGQYLNQLKSIGDGPGEYSSLDAFAYDEKSKVLSIYDRSKLSIFHYSFPDLQPINNFILNKYIMNMEYVDSETIMIISENEINQKGKYEGVMYISKNSTPLNSDIPIGNDVSSVELSYPNTITKISDTIYYAHPHEITTIYKMGKTVEPLYKIDFGKNKIPEKFWPVERASEFERSLAEGDKAVWVQNMILNEKKIAFSFLYREPETRYFYVRNVKDSVENIYKGYNVANSTYRLPNPIGSDGRSYVSLIYSENVDIDDIDDNKDFLDALRKSEKVGGYVLAIFKP